MPPILMPRSAPTDPNTEKMRGTLSEWLGLFFGPSPHFSPIDFFLGLRQFGGLLEMLEASNRVY
jgi:hypothetical protein